MRLLESSLNFNFYNIIILLGILHGLIFSLILLLNPKLKSVTNFYLAFTILALCGSNLQYLLLDLGVVLRKDYNESYVFIPFEFLMVPMFYFFVKSYLNNQFERKTVFLFSIPFLFGIFYQVLTKLLNVEYEFIDYLNKGTEYLSIVFSVVLIILILKEIRFYEKRINSINFKGISKTTHWLKRILLFGFLLCILWLGSITYLKSFLGKGYYKYYPLWIGISFLIYWVGYVSVFQNVLYTDRQNIRKKNDNKKKVKLPTKVKLGRHKFEAIDSIVKNEELYLISNINLKYISEKLSLSENYISQIINNNSDGNFNDYINGYRVDEAKKMLSNAEFNNYTITSIGLESGFNSKSSFYSAFKKVTSMTPVQFKKFVRNH